MMSMHDLIEDNDNYGKTIVSLWKYYGDEPSDNITDSESFKSKSRLTNNNGNASTVNVEIARSLKYFLKRLYSKVKFVLV